MKNRLIASVVAAFLAFTVVGCGGNKAPTVTPAPQSTSAQVVTFALDEIVVVSHAATLTAPPIVSAADDKLVSDAHDAVVTIVGAAGWKAKATAALNILKTKLSASAAVKVNPIIDAALLVIDSSAL